MRKTFLTRFLILIATRLIPQGWRRLASAWVFIERAPDEGCAGVQTFLCNRQWNLILTYEGFNDMSLIESFVNLNQISLSLAHPITMIMYCQDKTGGVGRMSYCRFIITTTAIKALLFAQQTNLKLHWKIVILRMSGNLKFLLDKHGTHETALGWRKGEMCGLGWRKWKIDDTEGEEKKLNWKKFICRGDDEAGEMWRKILRVNYRGAEGAKIEGKLNFGEKVINANKFDFRSLFFWFFIAEL